MDEATKKYYNKHFGQVIGGTIKSYCYDPDTDTHGLIVSVGKKKTRFVCWILCDPEGNGPGHLDIVWDES